MVTEIGNSFFWKFLLFIHDINQTVVNQYQDCLSEQYIERALSNGKNLILI